MKNIEIIATKEKGNAKAVQVKVGSYEVFMSKRTYENEDVYYFQFSTEGEYLPDIYADIIDNDYRGNNPFKIQTTSYGALASEDIAKVVAGYQEAVEVVEIINRNYKNFLM